MGHPDKMCDQISDAVLDAMLAQDPTSRVACETLTTTGLVFLAGEVTTKATVDFPVLVREVVRDIGYTDSQLGFDAATCAVQVAIGRQSPDIAQGVSEGEGLHKEQGAGDQGMMFGYACDETPEGMPAPIRLAHHLIELHRQHFESGEIGFLRPDAKSQVTIEYEDGRPVRVPAVVLSTQHDPDVGYDDLRQEIVEKIIRPCLPSELATDNTIFHVNPTGRFVVGPSKVDRSAAYAARWVAKNLVAANLARRCEVQIAYAIGVAEPVSIRVDAFGTGAVEESVLERLVRKHFDLTPRGIIESLDLLRPIYRATAYHGHFGRENAGFPWERTDKAEALRRDASR
jgi:S-adenosylmethionine synthetase